jgi:hypothetical protein
LEGELFAWVRHCESRKTCLTEIITKKKKRHDIGVRVLQGEARASSESADVVNIHIAKAMNSWNKVKILPVPVVVIGGVARDDVFDELRALLVSMGDECDASTFVDQPDER